MELLFTIVVCAMAAGFVLLVIQFTAAKRRYRYYVKDMRVAGLPAEDFEEFCEHERKYGKYVRLVDWL